MQEKKRGRKPKTHPNTYKERLKDWDLGFDRSYTNSLRELPSDMGDIVTGVSYLSEDTSKFKGTVRSLSRRKIVLCLATLDTISTENVQALLGLCERQSRNYATACRLCIKLFDLVGV